MRGFFTLGCLAALSAGWSMAAEVKLVDDKGVDLLKAPAVYTLTNLHPDDERARLYAVNFLQSGLIPRCTEVRLKKLGRDSLTFVVVSRGDRSYEYLNHEAAAEPFKNHLLRFFGSACNPADIERLSAVDRDGIGKGIAQGGMTRQGVIYALGYPPRHVNPSLESGDWTYWKNRYDRIIVRFDANGIVSGLTD